MLNDVKKYIAQKRKDGENFRVLKHYSDNESSEFYRANAYFCAGKAEFKEDISRPVRKVVRTENNISGFSYFLDGIQRSRPIFYTGMIPVTYGYCAAVIRNRADKIMKTSQFYAESQALYLPYKAKALKNQPEFYHDKSDFDAFKNIKLINTGVIDSNKEDIVENYPVHPQELILKANQELNNERSQLETNLAWEWVKSKSEGGWLFIDGPVSSICKNYKEYIKVFPNIVGVLKTHHTQYFSFADQEKIYKLKKGERSIVFRPDKQDVFSWYLRLHNPTNGDVNFGLIRIEIFADKKLLTRVDEISEWIMLETKPAAQPDSRWDRMIYPIRDCEEYLKSKAPTYTMIESLA